RRQPHLAPFGHPLLVRPWRDTDKMQQRLVLRRRPCRRGPRRHRLDALALARQHQTGAIIAQRPSPVNVTNYAHKPLDIRRKPRFAISVVLEIHLALQAPNSESLQLFDSQPQGPRPCDSVRLRRPARIVSPEFARFRPKRFTLTRHILGRELLLAWKRRRVGPSLWSKFDAGSTSETAEQGIFRRRGRHTRPRFDHGLRCAHYLRARGLRRIRQRRETARRIQPDHRARTALPVTELLATGKQ